MQSKQIIVLLSHKKCTHLTSQTLIIDLTYQPFSKLISNLSGFVMIISHLRLYNSLRYHNLKHINLKSQCLKYYNITSHKWYIPPSMVDLQYYWRLFKVEMGWKSVSIGFLNLKYIANILIFFRFSPGVLEHFLETNVHQSNGKQPLLLSWQCNIGV